MEFSNKYNRTEVKKSYQRLDFQSKLDEEMFCGPHLSNRKIPGPANKLINLLNSPPKKHHTTDH